MSFWKLFKRNKSAVLVDDFISRFSNGSACGVIFPEDPFKLIGKPYVWSGANGFLLGSDTLGRDVAAGIAHGARTSLMIATLATVVAVLIGGVFGGMAGYYGGWVDDILMRVTEMFQTIPSFIFAILIVAIMKPSIESIVIAIAVVSWPAVARLYVGNLSLCVTESLSKLAIPLGMSDARIMLKEILPNCLSPIIVAGSLMVATAILIGKWIVVSWLGRPEHY